LESVVRQTLGLIASAERVGGEARDIAPGKQTRMVDAETFHQQGARCLRLRVR
jgi:hypothetical protein